MFFGYNSFMKYCSLDLELSGFDPLKNEILELGFAFFNPTKNGLVVTETYSQVFRPQGEVHPKILGLTGISREELAAAPTLNECREFIQEKIGDAVLVGHNIAVDARFLEAFGFKLSGLTVDTLDLVQFLLPTHHSYNLENLMHYFSVSHPEAHRALADAKAVITVLERFLSIYSGFSDELKQRMGELTSRHQFTWVELMQYPFEFGLEKKNLLEKAVSTTAHSATVSNLMPKPGSVIVQPLGQRNAEVAAHMFEGSDQYLLIVPDKQMVISLWRQGLAKGVFSPEDLFSADKLNQFIAGAATPEEIIFCLKALVWLHTNWQTEAMVDLNFSFFGEQFRSMVTGQPMQEKDHEGLLACDYSTFKRLSEQSYYQTRIPVLWTTDQFEQWLNAGNESRLTWNRALYLLKAIYNPETDWGQREHKSIVLEGLAAVDLYFALVNMLLTRHFSGFTYISYEQLSNNPLVFSRLSQAASNLSDRFDKIANSVSSGVDLPNFGRLLKMFFDAQPDRVKWIEVHETNSVFFNQPLHIKGQVQALFSPYQAPVLINSQTDQKVMGYMLERLGLSQPSLNETRGLDLNEKAAQIELSVVSHAPSDSDILDCLKASQLPAVVLFQSPSAVKLFYDAHYNALKNEGRVFAQGYSGGSNKILRNFAINKASILLATPDFLVRQQTILKPKTVVISGLPEVNAKHPYTKALAEYWIKEFPEFMKLQNRQRFYQLMHSVWGTPFSHLYLFSTDFDNSWGENWEQYLKEIPHLKEKSAYTTGN